MRRDFGLPITFLWMKITRVNRKTHTVYRSFWEKRWLTALPYLTAWLSGASVYLE
jgi:hypothetical protein